MNIRKLHEDMLVTLGAWQRATLPGERARLMAEMDRIFAQRYRDSLQADLPSLSPGTVALVESVARSVVEHIGVHETPSFSVVVHTLPLVALSRAVEGDLRGSAP